MRYGVLCACLLWAASAAASDLAERGEYLFRLAGCFGCHTDKDGKGEPLAGGRAFETPFGTFYSPNITPDPVQGIGRWSEADFARALTEGVGPGGKHYYPVFPYTSYTAMRPDDVRALWAYLRTVAPSAQPSRPHDVPWYLPRLGNWAWKVVFFTPGPYRDEPGRSASWNRGAYIAGALAHCGECHTPRNLLGATRTSLAFAGTAEGPEGGKVPNITSDRDTGIGKWTRGDLLDFFKDGSTPGGDYTGGLMAEVVDNGLRHLTADDASALADYIGSLPPIRNAIGRKPEKQDHR